MGVLQVMHSLLDLLSALLDLAAQLRAPSLHGLGVVLLRGGASKRLEPARHAS